MIYRIATLVLLPFLATSAASAGDLGESVNLFFIKRSKNANEVHYDARVTGCAWKSPAVESYWRDLADDPYEYEEIKWFERRAYGFDVERMSDTAITIKLTALSNHEIHATLSPVEGGGCSVAVRTKIDGAEAEFRSVYVYARSGFPWPKVHYIEILGHADDGTPVWQRLPRTKKGKTIEPREPPSELWQSGAPTWGRPDGA